MQGGRGLEHDKMLFSKALRQIENSDALQLGLAADRHPTFKTLAH